MHCNNNQGNHSSVHKPSLSYWGITSQDLKSLCKGVVPTSVGISSVKLPAYGRKGERVNSSSPLGTFAASPEMNTRRLIPSSARNCALGGTSSILIRRSAQVLVMRGLWAQCAYLRPLPARWRLLNPRVWRCESEGLELRPCVSGPANPRV